MDKGRNMKNNRRTNGIDLGKVIYRLRSLPKKASVSIATAATPYITLFKMAFWPSYTLTNQGKTEQAAEKIADAPKKHLNCCR